MNPSAEKFLEKGKALSFKKCEVCGRITLHLIVLGEPHPEPIKFYAIKRCLNVGEHKKAEDVPFIFDPHNPFHDENF
jgi:hypothetical protein